MTALYRHFDKHGVLLYVGISTNVAQRLHQHEHNARWFDHVRRVDVEHFPTRDGALAAERAAIAAEHPVHNIRAGGASDGRFSEPRAVFQPSTGRADGWYRRYEDVLEILDFYAEQLPGVEHLVVCRSDPLAGACRAAIQAKHTIYRHCPVALLADFNKLEVVKKNNQSVQLATFVQQLPTVALQLQLQHTHPFRGVAVACCKGV